MYFETRNICFPEQGKATETDLVPGLATLRLLPLATKAGNEFTEGLRKKYMHIFLWSVPTIYNHTYIISFRMIELEYHDSQGIKSTFIRALVPTLLHDGLSEATNDPAAPFPS